MKTQPRCPELIMTSHIVVRPLCKCTMYMFHVQHYCWQDNEIILSWNTHALTCYRILCFYLKYNLKFYLFLSPWTKYAFCSIFRFLIFITLYLYLFVKLMLLKSYILSYLKAKEEWHTDTWWGSFCLQLDPYARVHGAVYMEVDIKQILSHHHQGP